MTLTPLLVALVGQAWAQGAPAGDDDKSMYAGHVLARAQWEPGLEDSPLGFGLTYRHRLSGSFLLGGGAGIYAKIDEGGTSLGHNYYEEEPGYTLSMIRPEIFGEYVLSGQPGSGWLVNGGLGWQSMTTWPGGVDETGDLPHAEVRGEVSRGGVLEARLGTGHRWVWHPGFPLQFEAGLRVRTARFGLADDPGLALLVPYVGVASGWSVNPDGPPPRPGYRARKVTGKHKPEVVTAVVAGCVAVASAATVGILMWHEQRTTELD